MTITELRERYFDLLDKHIEIMNTKANTFEESYIYQNDILNVKEQKFDNILVCFQALRNKVNYIKNSINRETEFNNTAASLDNLVSKFDMCIDTLQENSKKINVASRAAFNDYCQEYTTLEKKYYFNERIYSNKINSYLDNNDTISDKKSEIDILQNKIDNYQYGETIELNNWKTKISTLENEINVLESENKSHLLFMEYHLSKMADALDGLKILFNEALRKTTV